MVTAQPHFEKEKKLKLGARIRKIRMFRNITQKELGRRLGYGESSADVRIAQYESGQRTPKQETLIRIAEILEVDVRNFFKSWNCDNGRINGNFILDG